MKNLTNMMIAAAAFVVAAGAAQAQQLKVEIPFSFRAQGTMMPAGEYRVTALHSNGSPIFKLTSVDSNRAILAAPYFSNSGAPEGAATLSFQCGSNHCALDQIDPGAGKAYRFPTPKPGKGEDTHLSVIRAVLVNSR